jgi:hypothetical protein
MYNACVTNGLVFSERVQDVDCEVYFNRLKNEIKLEKLALYAFALEAANRQNSTNNFIEALSYLLYNNAILSYNSFSRVKMFMEIWKKRNTFKKIFICDKPVMRDFCLNCVDKHISTAYFLLQETMQGYPEHMLLARKRTSVDNAIDTLKKLKEMLYKETNRRSLIIGALSEAADECILEEPELADFIRQERLSFTYGGDIDIDAIIERISKCMQQ